jgi:hypothetical protein
VSQLVVAVDPDVGVDAAELARLWNEDAEARSHGAAETRTPGPGVFLPPELVEWVAIPLAVNLASTAVYDLVRRLLARPRSDQSRDEQPRSVEELEVIEHQTGSDRVVVVRLRREAR